MFSELVVAYLFLGGAGAGACVVLGLLECANIGRYGALTARSRRAGNARSCGQGRSLSAGPSPAVAPRDPRPWHCRASASFAVPHELMSRAWPAALVLLGAGALCLAADLGRPERVLALYLAPHFSVMTVGAWALLIAMVLATFFAVASNADFGALPLAVVLAAAIAAVAAGLVTAAYTGLLLSTLPSVLAFNTALVPVLFTLSSLSCGVAVVVAAASFVGSRHPFARALRNLVRIDGVLILAEAAILAAFVLWLASAPGTQAAAAGLTQGHLAVPFWMLLVAIGLVVPLMVERRYPAGDYRVKGLWIAACVLLGGAALRLCVTGLAAFDVTQMPELAFGLAAMN